MTHTLLNGIATSAGTAGAWLAQISTSLFNQFGIGAAILLTIAGMGMHWHLPRHRMSMEERVKDGKITEEAARQELRFYGWCAPIATLLGVAALVMVLLDLTG